MACSSLFLNEEMEKVRINKLCKTNQKNENMFIEQLVYAKHITSFPF